MSTVDVNERGVAAGAGGGLVEFWRPLAWSAIAGGAVTALGIQLILTLFGVGFGAAAINPMTDAYPDSEVSAGVVLWLFISGVISFGTGGWVAGHMSGVLRTGSGSLHGIVAWSLAAVLGAAVTAFAGAPILGGAAAGAGAAAPVAAADWSSLPGGTRVVPSGDGSVRYYDAYGRTVTEAEARATADEVRRATSMLAFCTGAAFLVSMAAAGIGGMVGRRSLDSVLREQRTSVTARPA